MKPEQIYREMITLSERLGIQVKEQNFRTAGIHVKSGFCKVKDQDLFLIDKHLKLSKKVEVLTDFLCEQPIDTMFVIPALRDHLEKASSRFGKRPVEDRTQ